MRLPGGPLVILRRVQARDVPRILDDLAPGTVTEGPRAVQDRRVGPPDRARPLRRGISEDPLVAGGSVLQAAEEDRAAQLRADQPDDIEEYIAIGGYQALYKVLIDANPEMVIEQIKAAKLRGRGGAGFLTGLKWEFPAQGRGRPRSTSSAMPTKAIPAPT